MRQMSFAMTTRQVRRREKTITRRMGWTKLNIGETIQAIVKGQGLKKGEKVEKLARITVLSVRRERLNRVVSDPEYGREELRREGFPDMLPEEFVAMICKANACKPDDLITRIEFGYTT